jgi:hypothetical protein
MDRCSLAFTKREDNRLRISIIKLRRSHAQVMTNNVAEGRSTRVELTPRPCSAILPTHGRHFASTVRKSVEDPGSYSYIRMRRLYAYITSVLRIAVPRPEDRIPLNKDTWPHLLSPVVPILLMAYLVRRPNTHLPRVLLLPIVLFTSLRAGYCYMWLDPRYNVYNFGGGEYRTTSSLAPFSIDFS